MKKMTKKELIASLKKCKNDDFTIVISDDGVSERFIVEEDGQIDFENTVYNFADNVMNDLKEFKSRKKFFGCDFANVDECYRWILNELGELYEMCFNFINEDYE